MEREAAQLRTHRFGSREVSVIGLGTADFGGRIAESLAREFLDAYIGIKGNFIDTARVYGDFATPKNGESEKVIGRWISDRHCRNQVFLSTKGGHPPLGNMRLGRLGRAEIRADIQASLEDLQTDCVDIYWLHRDEISRPTGEIMETLQELLEDGYTRLTGVSNWTPSRIMEANVYAAAHGLAPLYANQPQFSLAVQAFFPDDTLVSMDAAAFRMHKETGMTCCCFSSQAHGFFTKLDEAGESGLPESIKAQYLCKENRRIFQRIKQVRQATGLDVSSIALAYLTCQPFPTFALAGASRAEHITALEKAGNATLSASQLKDLRSF